jgi:hypothetical protein
MDGFWNSNALSSQIVACPNPAACSYPNRTRALAESQNLLINGSTIIGIGTMLSRSRNPSRSITEGEDQPSYHSLLCNPGAYLGKLCGICPDGYGSSGSSGIIRCSKCLSVTASRVLYALSMLMTFALVCYTVKAYIHLGMSYLEVGPIFDLIGAWNHVCFLDST